MKIDTLGVQAFVAIADHDSFSRAAQALHITQTGLTRRLQKGAYPRLRMVALANPVVSRTIVLLSRRKAYLAPAAQALYDLIRATAAKLAPR